MSITQALFAIALFFLPPELMVKWAGGARHDGVHITASDSNGNSAECVKSGLELHYRFNIRACRRRAMLFESCASPRIEVHSLQYDPISAIYTLTADRLGDGNQPKISHLASFDQAMKQMVEIPYMPLAFLDRGKSVKTRPNTHVGVRLNVACRGEYNALERLSYILSFGLLRNNSFDSGWVDFDLNR